MRLRSEAGARVRIKSLSFAQLQTWPAENGFLLPFICLPHKQKYVDTLSCRFFDMTCPIHGRDRMAHLPGCDQKPEKPGVHKPLGNSTDLARHLILSGLAVPA